MISIDEVRKLAALAHLLPEESELPELARQMEDIVAFADTINAMEADGQVFENIHGLANVFRTDEVRPSYDREQILRNADGGEEGFFPVKRRML